MMKLALITYLDKGKYASPTAENEDDILLRFLKGKGLNIEKIIWNDQNVNWSDFEYAILKSPWDYFDLINDFNAWLNQIEASGVKLLNPFNVVRWNSNKHYLKDIADAGLNVTPSAFLLKGEPVDLKAYFTHFNTQQLIVKPTVSGGAKNTLKITPENLAEAEQQLHIFLKDEDFIVQPFLKEIEETGEWSYLFFGGKFSHALLKTAKPGDFRVQHTFGGTIIPKTVTLDETKAAEQYIKQFAQSCLYARVDGVYLNGVFHLMELELIEPFLFLETDQNSYERYYQALRNLIGL
ncbi:ATP-grasp domain-containing protein [Pedobacter montanisoli]|uniref:Prokaryotic glutathione synthetase ATP-binding domain-containing protein n=1 Tax=Pedobacter montanisoli TaxID=2923277 RepID=A0ABS9ZVS4_9SPHI|nr:hypothetical protein [Pedobacter montanisoli]MCJ0742404.1 hypothetical protein [Pedobacter montanisoli]